MARVEYRKMPVVSIDEKIACSINALFGAALGFAIYFLPLSGWRFLFTKRGGEWWNGWAAFLVCVGGGALIGVMSYVKRHEQLNINYPQDGIYGEDEGGAWLLVRRIGVIIGAIVAFYFIWQLAKGI
jgi:hypothetical protein